MLRGKKLSPSTPYSFFYFIFLFKESLIVFILYRIWRWTAAPGRPGGLSLPHGPVPAPPSIAARKVLFTLIGIVPS